MIKTYKVYLPNGKYRIMDEDEFISIAKDKMMSSTALVRQYANREITRYVALKIFEHIKRPAMPVNALLIEVTEQREPKFKTIDRMEEDIEKFLFSEKEIENSHNAEYLDGSIESMVEILEEKLHYKIIDDDETTLKDFINKEVYFTSSILYKENKIKVELTDKKFICDLNTKKVYKYKSTIIDKDGYKFHFKKNELFASRKEAIDASKKLIDEHFNLEIRNSHTVPIIVRKDPDNNIIVFWPDKVTEDNYIMSNDVISEYDLAGDTKTSFTYFNDCKDATDKELTKAQNAIKNSLNIETKSVKHL